MTTSTSRHAYYHSCPRELWVLYDRLRSFSLQVSDHFKPSKGGDEYLWKGSMNMVEAMRDAITEVEGYMIENNIEVPSDDID